MKTYTASSLKCLFTWKAENPPRIDPANPVIEVTCGGIKIIARISPKNARKLEAHQGGGKIEGKLVLIDGRLELVEASAQMFDPKPAEPPSPLRSPPVGSPALSKLAELVRNREAR